MAFALDPLEPPEGELRRVLWEQTYHALRALREGDARAGVHKARKATRRARAALRMARAALTDEQYRSLQSGLRDVARTLSPIRDADVVHQLATAVGFSGAGPPEEADILRCADEARQRLQRLLAQIELEPLTIRRDALIKGFARGYRLARRRMVLARTEPSDANLHAWRKAVKIHRHQLQLVAPIWPVMLSVLEAEAEQLQADLGRQRDLSLLAAAMGELPPALEAEAAARTAAAFARGGPLFAAQDRLMGAWLRAQWEQRQLSPL